MFQKWAGCSEKDLRRGAHSDQQIIEIEVNNTHNKEFHI